MLRAKSYEDALESRVVDGLRAIGADVQGRRVLLKPNFVEYDPSTVINTDPRLVAATVVAVRRLGAAQVVVGEGPGHRHDTQYVMRSSGLLDALKAVDAPFVDLNAAGVVLWRLRSRYSTLRELWLPEIVDSVKEQATARSSMSTVSSARRRPFGKPSNCPDINPRRSTLFGLELDGGIVMFRRSMSA